MRMNNENAPSDNAAGRPAPSKSAKRHPPFSPAAAISFSNYSFPRRFCLHPDATPARQMNKDCRTGCSGNQDRRQSLSIHHNAILFFANLFPLTIAPLPNLITCSAARPFPDGGWLVAKANLACGRRRARGAFYILLTFHPERALQAPVVMTRLRHIVSTSGLGGRCLSGTD